MFSAILCRSHIWRIRSEFLFILQTVCFENARRNPCVPFRSGWNYIVSFRREANSILLYNGYEYYL